MSEECNSLYGVDRTAEAGGGVVVRPTYSG